MKDEKETKKKLLESAKKEFLKKGYMQASLRNICKDAGVTTGALYFFFQDKEDLFASLVEEPLHHLYNIMLNHFKEEAGNADRKGVEETYLQHDMDAAHQALNYMYEYQDEFQLILTKSQGSRFENCLDNFISFSEKHYRLLADQMTESTNGKRIDDYMIHWIAHMNTDLFVHMLTHEPSVAAANEHMDMLVKYMIAGWLALFE